MVKTLKVKSKSPTVTILVTILAGSGMEDSRTRGYAHFLEHMVFEGTPSRSNFDIANQVESLGGEMNGATNSERTMYYIKVPKKHTQKAVDILADILTNPLLAEAEFKKEKKVIQSEIALYEDDPKLCGWIKLEGMVFSSDLGKSTLGTKASIKNAHIKDLRAFYHKHYRSENVVVTLAGDIPKVNLSAFKFPKGASKKKFVEPPLKNAQETIKKEVAQSYFLLGYKTPKRSLKSAAVFDVLQAHMGRGASGSLFNELRNKRGVGYAVHVANEQGHFAGLFAVIVSCNQSSIATVQEVVLREIERAKELSKIELKEAISHVLGRLDMDLEDTKDLADLHTIAHLSGYTLKEYVQAVKSVSTKDLKQAIKVHLSSSAKVVVMQK